MSKIQRKRDSTMKYSVTGGWVFDDNNGGVYNKKLILHNKRWDVYMN